MGERTEEWLALVVAVSTKRATYSAEGTDGSEAIVPTARGTMSAGGKGQTFVANTNDDAAADCVDCRGPISVAVAGPEVGANTTENGVPWPSSACGINAARGD